MNIRQIVNTNIWVYFTQPWFKDAERAASCMKRDKSQRGTVKFTHDNLYNESTL